MAGVNKASNIDVSVGRYTTHLGKGPTDVSKGLARRGQHNGRSKECV
jgi:hypothetical protein